MDASFHTRLREAVGTRTFRCLSEITGTHHETVRRYMQGQSPSLDFVSSLCRALGLNANWLLGGHGPKFLAENADRALAEASVGSLLRALAAHADSIAPRLAGYETLARSFGAGAPSMSDQPLARLGPTELALNPSTARPMARRLRSN
ncbi:MAG: helix-turn-helix domain-containing protein [Phycisphaerales bacterium JB037]